MAETKRNIQKERMVRFTFKNGAVVDAPNATIACKEIEREYGCYIPPIKSEEIGCYN